MPTSSELALTGRAPEWSPYGVSKVTPGLGATKGSQPAPGPDVEAQNGRSLQAQRNRHQHSHVGFSRQLEVRPVSFADLRHPELHRARNRRGGHRRMGAFAHATKAVFPTRPRVVLSPHAVHE